MAGRHLIPAKPSLDTLTLTQARAAVAATAVGSMLGMVLPVGTEGMESSGAQALADISAKQVEETTAPAATEAITAAADAELAVAASLGLETTSTDGALDLSLSIELPEAPAATRNAVATPAVQAQAAAPAAQAQAAPAPAAQQEVAAPAPIPAGSGASAAVAIGRQYIGTPYRYAGSSPAGFDCSGFVSYVYAQMGYSLPHSSSAIRYSGTVVSAAAARPGDIMWWPGHVAIYTGSSQIEAMHYGMPLREGAIRGGATYIRVAN